MEGQLARLKGKNGYSPSLLLPTSSNKFTFPLPPSLNKTMRKSK